MLIRIIPMLLLLATLSGCGFHLRGSFDVEQLPASMRQMSIDGVRWNDALAVDLRGALKAAGVKVPRDGASATSVLNIISTNRKRRVLSVSATTGKVREFELYYSVVFDVSDANGKILIEKQTVNLVRDYIFDPTSVHGEALEEKLVFSEMSRDAVQQILRRIRAQVGAS